MRTLFKLLNLLLCLELIVAPFNPSLSLIIQDAHAQQTCAAGLTYDTVLNRCLSTAEAANVLNATASCAQSDVECYKTNAQNAFQDQVNKGAAPERKEGGEFVSTVANIAAVAGPVTMFAIGMSDSKATCPSMSFWAMVAGSVSLVVGDNLANILHKKRLKGIKDDWGKIVNPEDAAGDKDKERQASLEAQSQAFEMLARSEDSLASAAKMKKTFFMIAALAYGAATAISLIEILRESGPESIKAKLENTCVTVASLEPKAKESLYSYYLNDSKINIFDQSQFSYNLKHSTDLASFLTNKKALEEKNSTPSIEYYLTLKETLDKPSEDPTLFNLFKEISINILNNVTPIQHAVAEEVNTNAAKAYKEVEAKNNSILLSLGIAAATYFAAKALVGPQTITAPQRAIFGGVMVGLTTIMATHAGSQAEASGRRADLLRKMKTDFASASGAINACKSEDRTDPSKPTCYCYTADNQRNSARSSSAVCQKLWTGVNLASTSYTSGDGSADTKVCINNSQQADALCACKATNTCLKVTTNGITGLSAGTMSVIGQSLTPLNNLANGTSTAANVGSANLSNQAARMNALVKELEKNKNLADFVKTKDKKTDQLEAQLASASAGLGSGNTLGSTGSNAMPANAGEAARMLEKEIQPTNNAPTSIGGGGTLAAPGNTPVNENLEFGLTADQAAAQDNQVAEVMKQNLDYGGNDINPGSKTNIFEVLSNRYQRSGMRRLFDEKGTTKAEKPAQTDIAQ
jgi:hypothetical protein